MTMRLADSFHVEQPLATVWERLFLPPNRPTAAAECRLPGFPDTDGKPGCLATVTASEPQRLLRARKSAMPCVGSEIAIDIGPANAAGWPTRVSLAQSELPAAMAAMADLTTAHWRHIVADFRLYLERRVIAPPVSWGANLGATPTQTPTGLVLTDLADDGFAARCDMHAGDLLLTLGGIRIYDIGQLWTVLALSKPGAATAASWIHKDQTRTATAPL